MDIFFGEKCAHQPQPEKNCFSSVGFWVIQPAALADLLADFIPFLTIYPMCLVSPLDCMGDISRFGKMSHALTYDSSRGKVLRLRQYQTNTAAKHKQKARESQKRESSSRQLPL